MTSPNLSISTPYGRFYKHPSSFAEVPSITNVIGMKDKPALKYWYGKQVAIAAAENLEILNRMKTEQERIDYLKGAPNRMSQTAADRGDVVHDWIDQHIQASMRGERFEPTEEEKTRAGRTACNMWRQFKGFELRYRPEWIASEFTVWSDKYGYAGTGDWIMRLPQIGVVYGDNKTGNHVYPEVGLQISALANADYMIDPDGNQLDLPKCDKGAVLHVRPRFTRLHPLDNLDECFKAFLGLRACFEWHVEFEDSTVKDTTKVEAV